jgi:IS5 family transposase
MRQRLALTISSLAAAGVLAVGLTAAGFGPADQAQSRDDQGAETIDGTGQAAEAEVIYIKPAPEPKTVVVTRRSKGSDDGTRTRASSRVRAASREDEHEETEHRREAAKERREHEDHEREGDDD